MQLLNIISDCMALTHISEGLKLGNYYPYIENNLLYIFPKYSLLTILSPYWLEICDSLFLPCWLLTVVTAMFPVRISPSFTVLTSLFHKGGLGNG